MAAQAELVQPKDQQVVAHFGQYHLLCTPSCLPTNALLCSQRRRNQQVGAHCMQAHLLCTPSCSPTNSLLCKFVGQVCGAMHEV